MTCSIVENGDGPGPFGAKGCGDPREHGLRVENARQSGFSTAFAHRHCLHFTTV